MYGSPIICLTFRIQTNNRLKISSSIMLLFQIFLIRSMLWKILHLLVCFELRSCDFLVKSNFGPLTICLILVLLYSGDLLCAQLQYLYFLRIPTTRYSYNCTPAVVVYSSTPDDYTNFPQPCLTLHEITVPQQSNTMTIVLLGVGMNEESKWHKKCLESSLFSCFISYLLLRRQQENDGR
jgi:hypothetical protein